MARGTEHEAWIELLREEAPDELRIVSYRTTPTTTEISEQTDGAHTMLVFGALSRRQTITLTPESARSMVGFLTEAASRAGLDEGLHSFFSEGAYLSDLQDLLATAKVSYTYSVVSGAHAAFRPQGT